MSKSALMPLLILPVALFLVLLYYFNPESSSLFPPCPFRYLTGSYCPGCGSMRALHQLLNGHLLKAVDFNILMIISLPFLMFYLVLASAFTVLEKPLPVIHLSSEWIWAVFGLIIAYWVLRNIPVFPFTILAP